MTRQRDDEDDDRPRRKKRKKKSNAALFIGLGVGGAVLLVLLVAVVIVVAINAGGASPPRAAAPPVVQAPPIPPPPPPPKPNFDKVDIGEKKRPAGSIRARADRPERLNELRQIGLFYQQYSTEFNRPPSTVEEFTNYIKRDAGQIKQAIDEKYYVIVPKVRSAQGIVAYERDPDTNNMHGYVIMGGTADGISTPDLVAALKAQGSG